MGNSRWTLFEVGRGGSVASARVRAERDGAVLKTKKSVRETWDSPQCSLAWITLPFGVPRVVDKAEGLALLEQHRRELLGDGDGCVLCALVARAVDAPELVAENAHGVVLLDRFANRPGHLLVVSRAHCEDLLELGEAAYRELQALAYRGAEVLTRALEPERVFIAVLGASVPLPMTFPHFHVHVLPVYEAGEGARPAQVFSWSAGLFTYEEAEAGALAAKLRGFWPT